MLARLWLPEADVSVLERNPRGANYGWGVVFPESLLREVGRNCPGTASDIANAATRWDDQHVCVRGSRPVHLGRYGYSIGRTTLQEILASRCQRLGVTIRYGEEAGSAADLADADLVVAADGANSRLRTARADRFGTRIEQGRNPFIWLGTSREFDAFTFGFEPTTAGWIWFHAYRYAPRASTFIVECSPETWKGLGFDQMDAEARTRKLEAIFAEHLQGHLLLDQMGALGRVGWAPFRVITNETWVDGNLVLIGDAAHTAHFSIGSGTLLAVGDALALVDRLRGGGPLAAALRDYEVNRRPAVEKFQSVAANSSLWFENVCQALTQPAVEFGYALLHRREGPKEVSANRGWWYGVHLARQIGIIPEARRQLLATRRKLRSPWSW
jgi:anthraniloyl-CoA monooxygenase